MRWLHKALLQALIWLTAAATLVAGTPHLQCRCPSDAAKPKHEAPEGCCCCSKAVQEEEAPRTCCHQPIILKDDAAAPAFRPDSCQKQLVPAADATMQRAHAEGPQFADLALAPLDCLAGEALVQAHQVSIDVPPLPPPVDRQLVLQHFVI